MESNFKSTLDDIEDMAKNIINDVYDGFKDRKYHSWASLGVNVIENVEFEVLDDDAEADAEVIQLISE